MTTTRSITRAKKATIHSLPQEIIFLILEFASLQRLDILLSILGIQEYSQSHFGAELYDESNAVLCASALVSKHWTRSAQTLLLQAVRIVDGDKSIPKFINAPLDRFSVHQLDLALPGELGNETLMLGNLFSKLTGLKALELRNHVEGIERVLDVSIFMTEEFSRLEHLTLYSLSIDNESNFTLTTPLFNLKTLNLMNSDLPESALQSIISPSLTELSITESRSQDKNFVEGLKLAAPYLKYLRLHYFVELNTLAMYIPIISLCNLVTEFSFSFLGPKPSFLSIISAFATNQLLQLKLFFYHTTDLPNLLTLISEPSLGKLQSLTLIAYKYQQGTLEEIAIPIEVSAGCARSGIIYKYEIIEFGGDDDEDLEEEE